MVRLFYLQIIKHDEYVALANSEQVKRLTIPAKRGLIYAMDGTRPVELVLNETVYTLFADPKIIKDKSKITDTIHRIAGGNVRPNIDVLLDKKRLDIKYLLQKLSRAQAELIKKEKLAGIGFQEVSQRVYPEGA